MPWPPRETCHDPKQWAAYAKASFLEQRFEPDDGEGLDELSDRAGREVVERAFELALRAALDGRAHPFEDAYKQADDELIQARPYGSVEAMIRSWLFMNNAPASLWEQWAAEQGLPPGYYDEYEVRELTLAEFAEENYPWFNDPDWREPAWVAEAGGEVVEAERR